MVSTFKTIAKRLAAGIWDLVHRKGICLVYISPEIQGSHREAVEATANFFSRLGLRVDVVDRLRLWDVARGGTLLTAGQVRGRCVRLLQFIGRTQGVDPFKDTWAAWAWHGALARQYQVPRQVVRLGRVKLQQLARHNQDDRGKVYIFGTGPSLDLAEAMDFSDGVRVVCNTVVKNEALLAHVKPHVIVAGDALYHFGDAPHAQQFRKDLYRAMGAHKCLFVFPAEFYPVLSKECPPQLTSMLIPVPQGRHEHFLPTLATRYRLPNLGNVLNRLLIPLALVLGSTVHLLGFDGRKASDSGFWTNSNRNSYPELLEALKKQNPAFFSSLVPEADPNKYVDETLGNSLAANLQECVGQGWTFSLLAPSALPGLSGVPETTAKD